MKQGIAKWKCRQCGKVFYTEGSERPVCHCGWDSEVNMLWVDFEPTKRVWDEIQSSGCSLKRKFATKKDAWIFSAHVLAESDKEAQEMIEDLPF